MKYLILLILLTLPATTYPSLDGDIGVNVNTSYDIAHSVAECVDCSSQGVISCENSIGEFQGITSYSVIRAIINFDTSYIGDSPINSAMVCVKPTATHFDFTGNDFIRLVPNYINGQYSLSDFNNIGITPMAADVYLSSLVTNEYVCFPLNAAGLAAINRTGTTKFGLRLGLDINNVQPIKGTDENFPDRGGSVVFFYSAESLNPPKLIVNTNATPPPPPPPPPAFDATITVNPQSGIVPFTAYFGVSSNRAVTSIVWKKNGAPFSVSLTPSLSLTTEGVHRIDATVTSGNESVTRTLYVTAVKSCGNGC